MPQKADGIVQMVDDSAGDYQVQRRIEGWQSIVEVSDLDAGGVEYVKTEYFFRDFQAVCFIEF